MHSMKLFIVQGVSTLELVTELRKRLEAVFFCMRGLKSQEGLKEEFFLYSSRWCAMNKFEQKP